MTKYFLLFSIGTFLLNSCSILQTSSKSAFTDGYYKLKKGEKSEKVYVDFEDAVIRVYSASGKKKQTLMVDSTTVSKMLFPKEQTPNKVENLRFSHNTFDLDFFTMPVKFRPTQNGIPAQLNGNLNGALYFGYRHDQFNLDYAPNPLGKSKRSTTHYACSFGAFLGFGNTFMSSTNTNNYINIEYEGIVLIKGIAALVALNQFTVGLSLGFDNLLDKNHPHWNYEGKPWLGLALGINLN